MFTNPTRETRSQKKTRVVEKRGKERIAYGEIQP